MVDYNSFLKEQLGIVKNEKREQRRIEQYNNASVEYNEFDRLAFLHKAYINFITEFYPKWFEEMIKFYRNAIFEEGIENFMFNAIFYLDENDANNMAHAGCKYKTLKHFSRSDRPDMVYVSAGNTEYWNMLENFFIRNNLLVDSYTATKSLCVMGSFEQLRDAYYNEMQALPLYQKLNEELEMYDGANLENEIIIPNLKKTKK